MMTSQQIESRANLRVPVRLSVTVELPPRIERNSVRGVTRDISLSGAFIENSGSVPREGSLARLALETAPGGALVIDAVVLRSNDQGMGLMFAHYGDEIFEPLAALLAPMVE